VNEVTTHGTVPLGCLGYANKKQRRTSDTLHGAALVLSRQRINYLATQSSTIMADVENELSQELARIVACSYPPSLTVSVSGCSLLRISPAFHIRLYVNATAPCTTRTHDSWHMQPAIADVHEEIGRHPVPCGTNSRANMHAQLPTFCSHQVSHRCFCRTPPLGMHSGHTKGSLYVTASPFRNWSPTNRALAGHSPEFRDKLLLQTPGLLDALLAKANSSQQDFDEVGSGWNTTSSMIRCLWNVTLMLDTVHGTRSASTLTSSPRSRTVTSECPAFLFASVRQGCSGA
jgi:hypothetical protein